MLRQLGYRVVVMNDIETIKKAVPKDKPDMIFLEYERKEMDGDEFIKRLKTILPNLAENKWREQENIPMIVYTHSDKDYRENLGKNGLKWAKEFDSVEIWEGMKKLYKEEVNA